MSTIVSKTTYFTSPIPEDWVNGTEYDNYQAAEIEAEALGWCVTEVTYEFYDSNLVKDFRDPLLEADDPVYYGGRIGTAEEDDGKFVLAYVGGDRVDITGEEEDLIRLAGAHGDWNLTQLARQHFKRPVSQVGTGDLYLLPLYGNLSAVHKNHLIGALSDVLDRRYSTNNAAEPFEEGLEAFICSRVDICDTRHTALQVFKLCDGSIICDARGNPIITRVFESKDGGGFMGTSHYFYHPHNPDCEVAFTSNIKDVKNTYSHDKLGIVVHHDKIYIIGNPSVTYPLREFND